MLEEIEYRFQLKYLFTEPNIYTDNSHIDKTAIAYLLRVGKRRRSKMWQTNAHLAGPTKEPNREGHMEGVSFCVNEFERCKSIDSFKYFVSPYGHIYIHSLGEMKKMIVDKIYLYIWDAQKKVIDL